MKKLKTCLIALGFISLFGGCSHIEEKVYEMRTTRFAYNIADILQQEDFETFVEQFDTFSKAEYEDLSPEEKDDFQEGFYEITGRMKEYYGENWNKKMKTTDFKGSTVTVPGRTAIECSVQVYIKVDDDKYGYFILDNVEEEDEMMLNDAFYFLSHIQHELDMFESFEME